MEDEVPDLVTQEGGDLAPELTPVEVITESTPRVPVTIITGFLGSGKVRKDLSPTLIYP